MQIRYQIDTITIVATSQSTISLGSVKIISHTSSASQNVQSGYNKDHINIDECDL